MKVLALSTSTHRGSAAVLEDDRVLGKSGYADLGGHAERIFAAITEALAAAGTARSDIGLVVCDIGPGSFTGVRVGVASAKGLAVGLGVPLVGVGSLEAMAFAAFTLGLVDPKDTMVAVLDAKKQEFFLAAYDASGQTVYAPVHVAIGEASQIVEVQLSRSLHGRVGIRLVGEAALLDPNLEARVVRSLEVDLPDAVAIGRLGLQRFASAPDSKQAFDPEVVEPSYVRPPDAKPMLSVTAT